MLKRTLLLLAFSAPFFFASAQMSIQFIPEVYGRNMEGLMSAGIINASAKTNVRLSVSVVEDKLGKVLSILTDPFTVAPGTNRIPASAIRPTSVRMENNAASRFLQKNGYLPQGNYEYSYQVVSAIAVEEIITEQTFNHEVLPPAPLNLIEPYNEDQICNKKPLLTWQPSIPVVSGMLYELLLAEIKDRQSPVEALNYNLPVVKQKGIANPLLLYPPSAKELLEGKRYAWQVTAYMGETIVNRSEVWEFKVDCKHDDKPVEDDYGYRDIDDLFKGNYYIAKGFVKFTLINSYKEQPLKYQIIGVTDPRQKLKRLPKVKLKNGKNKISIDLSRNFSFKDGYSYLLILELPNGGSRQLRFIYNDLE